MIARFCPFLIRLGFCAVVFFAGLAFAPAGAVLAEDYAGPVFPSENLYADPMFDTAAIKEPPKLPKKNPLLQRPKNKQVVFDDLDPVSDVVPQSFLDEEGSVQERSAVRQKTTPQIIDTETPDNNTVFTPQGEMLQGTMQPSEDFNSSEIIGNYPDELNGDMGAYLTGPIVQTFGMGLFDNLTLFTGTTTFKTELNNRVGNDTAGSWGINEGLNWSTPITPQGTITAQYGIRAVHGDVFSDASRHQTFMTAGIFKRFDIACLQGGVAVDWLHDHSRFGSVDLRQMRTELSLRSFSGLEYGFTGAFDVFQDQPTTPQINSFIYSSLRGDYGAVTVQDYYMLFVRKHLNSGGQIELRCGATEWGDFIMSAQGESAISDRLSVNGGLTMLAPAEGHSAQGNGKESWAMSVGVVLYFRGGAMSRQTNSYRPMFDIAGNHSFFPRIVGRWLPDAVSEPEPEPTP